MARIPMYQQGQIASSRTGVSPIGTPGVDTSNAQMLNSLAQNLGQTKNAVYALASDIRQEEMVELRRKEAEIRAANKALETQKRQTEVGLIMSDLDVKATELRYQVEEKYQNNTDGAVKAFQEGFDVLSRPVVDGIQDELMKYQVQEKVNTLKGSMNRSVNEFVASRRLPIMESNIKQTAANFVTKAQDLRLTEPQVGASILKYHEDNINTYKTLYGGNAEEMMRKDLEVGVKQRLSAIANSGNIASLNAALKAYDDVLDPSDKQEFISDLNQDAANKAKILEQERKYNVSVETYNILNDIDQKGKDGTLTTGDVHQAQKKIVEMGGSPSAIRGVKVIQNSYMKTAEVDMEQERKKSEKTVRENEAKLFKKKGGPVRTDLINRFDSLMKKKQGKVLRYEGVTPDQITDFYADVKAAEAEGFLTGAEVKSYTHSVNLVLKQFDRKDPQGAAHARALQGEVNDIVKSAVSFSKDPDLNNLYGTKFINGYMDAVTRKEQRDGKPLSVAKRKILLDAAQKQAIIDAQDEYKKIKLERERLILKDLQTRGVGK